MSAESFHSDYLESLSAGLNAEDEKLVLLMDDQSLKCDLNRVFYPEDREEKPKRVSYPEEEEATLEDDPKSSISPEEKLSLEDDFKPALNSNHKLPSKPNSGSPLQIEEEPLLKFEFEPQTIPDPAYRPFAEKN